MLNKKGRLDASTLLIWTILLSGVAYVSDFGGFKEVVNEVFGTPINSTTVENFTKTETVSTQTETTKSITNKDSTIGPSFFDRYGLILISIILIGGVVFYFQYNLLKNKEAKNDKFYKRKNNNVSFLNSLIRTRHQEYL